MRKTEKTARASPLRHSGDVTEAERHQAADDGSYGAAISVSDCTKGLLKEC